MHEETKQSPGDSVSLSTAPVRQQGRGGETVRRESVLRARVQQVASKRRSYSSGT